MINLYHLDCCDTPDHYANYGYDGCGHRWQCRSCHMWWTPQEYQQAAEHDEELECREREYFEYGREEMRRMDADYDLACWPDEVYR